MEKRYYSISEVADMFKVNQSHLRFLERQFPQLSPKRSAKGTRFYTKDDIQVIRLCPIVISQIPHPSPELPAYILVREFRGDIQDLVQLGVPPEPLLQQRVDGVVHLPPQGLVVLRVGREPVGVPGHGVEHQRLHKGPLGPVPIGDLGGRSAQGDVAVQQDVVPVVEHDLRRFEKQGAVVAGGFQHVAVGSPHVPRIHAVVSKHEAGVADPPGQGIL